MNGQCLEPSCLAPATRAFEARGNAHAGLDLRFEFCFEFCSAHVMPAATGFIRLGMYREIDFEVPQPEKVAP
jgi:hypothetical protein